MHTWDLSGIFRVFHRKHHILAIIFFLLFLSLFLSALCFTSLIPHVHTDRSANLQECCFCSFLQIAIHFMKCEFCEIQVGNESTRNVRTLLMLSHKFLKRKQAIKSLTGKSKKHYCITECEIRSCFSMQMKASCALCEQRVIACPLMLTFNLLVVYLMLEILWCENAMPRNYLLGTFGS